MLSCRLPALAPGSRPQKREKPLLGPFADIFGFAPEGVRGLYLYGLFSHCIFVTSKITYCIKSLVRFIRSLNNQLAASA